MRAARISSCATGPRRQRLQDAGRGREGLVRGDAGAEGAAGNRRSSRRAVASRSSLGCRRWMPALAGSEQADPEVQSPGSDHPLTGRRPPWLRRDRRSRLRRRRRRRQPSPSARRRPRAASSPTDARRARLLWEGDVCGRALDGLAGCGAAAESSAKIVRSVSHGGDVCEGSCARGVRTIRRVAARAGAQGRRRAGRGRARRWRGCARRGGREPSCARARG